MATLPSPEEIRRRAAAIRGVPVEISAPTEDDWDAWEQERETLQAADEIDEAEWRHDAAQRKLAGQSAILRDIVSGVSHRAASANAGAPVTPGKDIPHFRAYAVVLWCKRLMLRGLSDAKVAAHFGVTDCRNAVPHMGKIRERLHRDCHRKFSQGWRIEKLFAHYFKGDAEPDKETRLKDCRKQLAKLKGQASRTLSRGTRKGKRK